MGDRDTNVSFLKLYLINAYPFMENVAPLVSGHPCFFLTSFSSATLLAINILYVPMVTFREIDVHISNIDAFTFL